jgi:hypothetical protein
METRQTKDEKTPETSAPESLTITDIKPDTMPLGEPDFTIRVFGTGLTSNSMITVNRDNRPTEFTPPNRVTAVVEMHMLTTPGVYPITVKDGAIESNEIDFTVTAPLTAEEKARCEEEKSKTKPLMSTSEQKSRPTLPPSRPKAAENDHEKASRR